MARLIFVRHGQATVRDGVYDPLTERGRSQSRALGRAWAARGFTPARVFVGPRARHRETAEAVADEVTASGLPWPEPIPLDALDEYPAEHIVRRSLSEEPLGEGELGVLERLFTGGEARAGAVDHERRAADTRQLAKRFERIMRAWVRGELVDDELETWSAFRDRIEGAIRHVQETSARGEQSVAFTSGGPVAVAAGYAFSAPDEKVLETSWLVHNTSETVLVHRADRLTLGSFNVVAHLGDRDPWNRR